MNKFVGLFCNAGVSEGFVLVSTTADVWTNNWTTMAP